MIGGEGRSRGLGMHEGRERVEEEVSYDDGSIPGRSLRVRIAAHSGESSITCLKNLINSVIYLLSNLQEDCRAETQKQLSPKQRALDSILSHRLGSLGLNGSEQNEEQFYLCYNSIQS